MYRSNFLQNPYFRVLDIQLWMDLSFYLFYGHALSSKHAFFKKVANVWIKIFFKREQMNQNIIGSTKYSWLNTESICYCFFAIFSEFFDKHKWLFWHFFYLGKQRSYQNKQELNCSVISILSLADPMEKTLDIFVVDHIERAPIRYREKKN